MKTKIARSTLLLLGALPLGAMAAEPAMKPTAEYAKGMQPKK